MLKYHPQQFLMKGLVYFLFFLVRKRYITTQTLFRIMYPIDTALTTAHEYLHFIVAYIMKYSIGYRYVLNVYKPVVSKMYMRGDSVYFGDDSYCRHQACFFIIKSGETSTILHRVLINICNTPYAISSVSISLAPLIPTIFVFILCPIWFTILFTYITLGNFLPSIGDVRTASRALIFKFG